MGGGPSDETKWSVPGVCDLQPMSDYQIDIIESNVYPYTNSRSVILALNEGNLLNGYSYTLSLVGTNLSGTETTNLNFTVSSSDFYNKKHTYSAKYPVNDLTSLKNLDEDQKTISRSFSNGLGFVIQTSIYRNAPFTPDIITPIYYDDNLQSSKIFLPYACYDQNGTGFRPNAFAEQSDYYQSLPPEQGVDASNYPYSEKIYERSPLFRTLEQGFTGANYQPNTNHTIRTFYETNTSTDNVQVLILGVSEGTDTVITIGDNYYPEGTLYKTKTIDENQVVSYLYKDKNDKEILKVTMDGSDPIKTYYVETSEKSNFLFFSNSFSRKNY